MTTGIQPFEGTYTADPIHSSLGFGVRYSGISNFRGTLDDVTATLDVGHDGLVLEGTARAESISIHNPPEFRAHVLGPEFFDAERHPQVTFRSTGVDLGDDGTARLEGDLTIKGITRPVVATGTWSVSDAGRVGLVLESSFDRRDFGFDWQMALPGGGEALDWQVTLTVNLVLAPDDQAAGSTV